MSVKKTDTADDFGSHDRRSFLSRLLTGLAGFHVAGLETLSAGGAAAAAASADLPGTTWGINTNIDVWPYYARSVEDAIARVGPLLEALPCRIVREGLQGSDRGNDLDAIRWDRWFDPWVDWLAEHRMQMCLELLAVPVANPGNAYGADWEQRILHKCRAAAEYVHADPKRRQVVTWFLLANEPDMQVGRKGGLLTPERLVRCHELAWQAIKSVNPDFLIEGLTLGDGAGMGAAFPLRAFNLGQEPDDKSPPLPGKSVPGMLSKDLFDLGITRFCDLVGFHSYVEITEDNPYGARALVENMRAAHAKFGYPIRPLVNTETGCHDVQFNRRRAGSGRGRKPVDVSDEARYTAIAHWQHFNRVQLARWGVSRSLFYLLGGSPGAPWMQIADYPMKAYHGPPYAKRPSFQTAAAALAVRPLAMLNGGFEQPEDRYSNWVVHYEPHDFHSADFVYGEWKETHFLQDGDRLGIGAPGTTGTGYLRLDAGLPKIVRRVVEGLESGRTYRLSAWVRQMGSATATLAVYGFDQTDPGCAASVATTKTGDWIKLTTTFTPKRSIVGVDCWGVVSLEHTGEAVAYWDDVGVERIT